MEAVEQGSLRLSGIPCEGVPFRLKIRQGFNCHGMMEAAIWVPEEAGQISTDMQVVLTAGKQGESPLFCGLVTSALSGREKGRRCAYIKVQTSSIQMDRDKRRRSFQNQGRSYEQLVGLLTAPYQAFCAWEGSGAGQTVGRFLLQYDETDWQFVMRMASAEGLGLLPEARLSQTGFYIGLPDGREETELKAENYSMRSCMAGTVKEDGTVSAGPEFVIRRRYETLQPGDRVRFRANHLAVAEKESILTGGLVQSSYVLRSESGFRTAPVKNYRMIGAAVPGTVLESSPDMSRLRLNTDGGDEAAESWHRRPSFYTGGGKGYGGRPESGDTLYLYFPTENEADRSVIGGAGASYEKLQTVTQQIMDDTESEMEQAREQQALLGSGTAGQGIPQPPASKSAGNTAAKNTGSAAPKKAEPASTPGFKNWSTPKGKGLSLNAGGIRLQDGAGEALSLNGSGILFGSTGGANLKGKNGINVTMLYGKQVHLQAKEYVYIKCGMSEVALLPEEIHIKGTNVYLESPLNEDKGPVLSDVSVKELKAAYYQDKWGSPLQLFMPDGTVIGNEKSMLGNEALRAYFNENVLGTGEYINYLASPSLEKYYEDGTIDTTSYGDPRDNYEDMLYRKWISATYGKTEWEKFAEMLSTREGMHAALDVLGIGVEAADVANAVIYLTEGDLGNAALSGISAFLLVGELIGKSGKGAKYIAKGADLAKLGGSNVVKTLKKLDSVKIFVKVQKADVGEIGKWFQKWGDDLDDMLKRKPYVEYVTPEGLRYRVEMSQEMKMSMEVTDGAGGASRYGRTVGSGDGEVPNAIKGGSGAVNDIVKQGQKALDQFDIESAYVKPKHLSTTGGNGQKFLGNTKVEAEAILKDAMKNGTVKSITDNGLTKAGNASYEIVIDAGKAIGSKGENLLKIIISEDGGMLSAYPIN